MTLQNATGELPSENTYLRQNSTSQAKNLGCTSQWDGFTIISISFVVMTFAITFALVLQIHYGNPEVTPHGAVATDERQCSEIGISLMKDGGNAVDVALASLVCLSVTHPHLVGPGGGGVILIHDHKKNLSKVIDFMSGIPQNLPYPVSLDSNDGRSIGVPGFLRGLKTAHEKFGVLPWKQIFEPSIELARGGFNVSAQLVEEVSKENPADSEVFKKVFFPKGFIVTKDQLLKRPRYAQFLEDVAEKGPNEFYLLKYGVELVEALKESGSKVSVADLHNYEAREGDVITTKIQHLDLITAGLPFGGLQAISGLHFLNRSGVNLATTPSALYYEFAKSIHYGALKLVEAVKYDHESPNFLEALLQDDVDITDHPWILPNQPAAQVSSVDAFDLYATAIVGLGTSFGSRIMTEHEIILNNHLFGDFRDAKFDKTTFHNRPFNPYTPLILVDHKNVCGNRIILSSGSSSSIMQVASHILFRNFDMIRAIKEPRIALGRSANVLQINDFQPDVERLSGEIREYLTKKNYNVTGLYIPLAVNGVSKKKDTLVSHSDRRGGGFASRLSGIIGGGATDGKNQSTLYVKTSRPSNVAKLVVPHNIHEEEEPSL